VSIISLYTAGPAGSPASLRSRRDHAFLQDDIAVKARLAGLHNGKRLARQIVKRKPLTFGNRRGMIGNTVDDSPKFAHNG